jgi:hypothetical protein
MVGTLLRQQSKVWAPLVRFPLQGNSVLPALSPAREKKAKVQVHNVVEGVFCPTSLKNSDRSMSQEDSCATSTTKMVSNRGQRLTGNLGPRRQVLLQPRDSFVSGTSTAFELHGLGTLSSNFESSLDRELTPPKLVRSLTQSSALEFHEASPLLQRHRSAEIASRRSLMSSSEAQDSFVSHGSTIYELDHLALLSRSGRSLLSLSEHSHQQTIGSRARPPESVRTTKQTSGRFAAKESSLHDRPNNPMATMLQRRHSEESITVLTRIESRRSLLSRSSSAYEMELLDTSRSTWIKEDGTACARKVTPPGMVRNVTQSSVRNAASQCQSCGRPRNPVATALRRHQSTGSISSITRMGSRRSLMLSVHTSDSFLSRTSTAYELECYELEFSTHWEYGEVCSCDCSKVPTPPGLVRNTTKSSVRCFQTPPHGGRPDNPVGTVLRRHRSADASLGWTVNSRDDGNSKRSSDVSERGDEDLAVDTDCAATGTAVAYGPGSSTESTPYVCGWDGLDEETVSSTRALDAASAVWNSMVASKDRMASLAPFGQSTS